MANPPPTQEELTLRRRARRRLVGAIALALAAVVVLPMIFDPEPRPLGDNVDIRIPDPKTPFQPALPAEPEASGPVVAPLPAPDIPAPADDVHPSRPLSSAPVAGTTANSATPEQKPVRSEPARLPPQTKPADKPEARPEGKSEPRTERSTPSRTSASDKVDKPASKPGIHAAESRPKEGVAARPVKPVSDEPPGKMDKPAGPDRPSERPASAGDAAKPGGFQLQIGAFSNADYARQLAERARAAGYPALVVASGGQNRVRVGPYPSRDQAQAAAARLSAQGFKPVLVSH